MARCRHAGINLGPAGRIPIWLGGYAHATRHQPREIGIEARLTLRAVPATRRADSAVYQAALGARDQSRKPLAAAIRPGRY